MESLPTSDSRHLHTCLLNVASVVWSHACSGNFSSCPEGSCHGNRQPLSYLRMVPSMSCAMAVWVSGLAVRQSKGPGERVVRLGGGGKGEREGREWREKEGGKGRGGVKELREGEGSDRWREERGGGGVKDKESASTWTDHILTSTQCLSLSRCSESSTTASPSPSRTTPSSCDSCHHTSCLRECRQKGEPPSLHEVRGEHASLNQSEGYNWHRQKVL